MKKPIHIILAFLLTVSSLFAGDREWNFSSWNLNPGGYTAILTTIDDLMLYNRTGSTSFGVIDGSVKIINGITYTRRLKMGGAGYTTQAVPPIYRPTQRYLAFLVDGDASITVGFTTATTGAERICYITNGEQILGQAMESANEGVNFTANYVGPADTLFIFGNNAINMYHINVCYTTQANLDVKSNSTLKKVGNDLINPEELDVEVYTIMGMRILSSKESVISISGLPESVYIARTNKGVFKFIK